MQWLHRDEELTWRRWLQTNYDQLWSVWTCVLNCLFRGTRAINWQWLYSEASSLRLSNMWATTFTHRRHVKPFGEGVLDSKREDDRNTLYRSQTCMTQNGRCNKSVTPQIIDCTFQKPLEERGKRQKVHNCYVCMCASHRYMGYNKLGAAVYDHYLSLYVCMYAMPVYVGRTEAEDRMDVRHFGTETLFCKSFDSGGWRTNRTSSRY